jgi:hypothetical protein
MVDAIVDFERWLSGKLVAQQKNYGAGFGGERCALPKRVRVLLLRKSDFGTTTVDNHTMSDYSCCTARISIMAVT